MLLYLGTAAVGIYDDPNELMTSMHCIKRNYLVRYFAQMIYGYGIIHQDTT